MRGRVAFFLAKLISYFSGALFRFSNKVCHRNRRMNKGLKLLDCLFKSFLCLNTSSEFALLLVASISIEFLDVQITNSDCSF